MGVCDGVGGNMMRDAFGIVAMVAMAPLIVIQLMGLIYANRTKTSAKQTERILEAIPAEDAGAIIEFEEEPSDE
jgi:hypothetical protein